MERHAISDPASASTRRIRTALLDAAARRLSQSGLVSWSAMTRSRPVAAAWWPG